MEHAQSAESADEAEAPPGSPAWDAASVRSWLAGLPDDRRAAHLARAAVEMADRGTSGVIAYELLLIFIFISTPYPQEHPVLVGALLGVTVLIGLLRFACIRGVRARQGLDQVWWTTRFGNGASLAALTWSAFLCITIWIYPWQWPFWLTLFCSSGLAAGAATALSPDQRLARRYLLILFVPASILLVAEGSTQGVTLGLIFATYLAFLLMQTARHYGWYWQSLREGELLRNRSSEIRQIHARHAQELEEELESLKNHLLRVDRLATLGTLAGATGHELNNIQMVLTAAAESIATALAEGRPPSQKDLERLRLVESHVSVHAKQLLSLGKPDREEVGRLELCHVIRETVDMLHAARRTKTVEVDLDLPVAPLWVRATRTRVEQVLVNLIGNAVDALEEVARPGKRVRIRIDSGASSLHVHVAIEDNGIGMDEGQIAQIFQPYFTTKAPGRGTGLGLPVVKQILEGLGGHVSVSSEPGVGSTFVAALPLFGGPEPDPPDGAAALGELRPSDELDLVVERLQ